MEVEGQEKAKPIVPPADVDPEVETFVAVLVLTWLVDQRRLDEARTLSERLVEQIVLFPSNCLD